MAAGGDPATNSPARTEEETQPTGKSSEEHFDGGVVQHAEPPKSGEVIQESTDGDGAEEEEEGECGFCLFMKGGPCREVFVAWEDCVEAAERRGENIVDSCFQATGLLRSCMEAHVDYYEPILRAEKAMEEEADRTMQHQQETEQEPEGPDAGSSAATGEITARDQLDSIL